MRRFLTLSLLLLIASPLYATRTAIATDNFNRTSGGLGANWASLNPTWADMVIVANLRVTGNSSGGDTHRAAARWVGAGSFTDDQYSSTLITALGFITSDYSIGAVCRAGSGTNSSRNYYEVVVLADSSGPNYTTEVNKVVAGTFTSLNSASRAWATSDRIEIECQGTTIRGLKNGTAFFTVTDSSLSTGLPGIAGTNDGTDANVTGDDWEGGNLTVSTKVTRRVISSMNIAPITEIWLRRKWA